MGEVKTVVVGRRPAELEQLIRRRRTLGLDLFDELWEGVLHMTPAPGAAHGMVAEELAATLREPARLAGLRGTGPFNLGASGDYRVPDGGFHRGVPAGVWLSTAAIVIEVVSPDDETFEKFDFFVAHEVDEVVVADPARRSVRWWLRADEALRQTDRSPLLGVHVVDVEASIDWP